MADFNIKHDENSSPRTPLVWAYELQAQRDNLLDAAKYALRVIADHNGGGGLETPQQLRIAQQKLFDAVSAVDPGYYGITRGSITR